MSMCVLLALAGMRGDLMWLDFSVALGRLKACPNSSLLFMSLGLH